jgi:predicted Zn finger-like uncharacterized protein
MAEKEYISTRCEGCGKQYRIKSEKIKGEKALMKCRACGEIITFNKPVNESLDDFFREEAPASGRTGGADIPALEEAFPDWISFHFEIKVSLISKAIQTSVLLNEASFPIASNLERPGPWLIRGSQKRGLQSLSRASRPRGVQRGSVPVNRPEASRATCNPERRDGWPCGTGHRPAPLK